MAVRIKSNAKALAVSFRRRAKAMTNEMERAERLALADLKRTAIGFTSARAYRMDENSTHPYSRRRPHPPLPPFLANIQSGRMNRSWRTLVRRRTGHITSTLYNTAPYSADFDGRRLRRMIDRPLKPKLLEVQGKNRRKKIRKAVQSAMSKR